MIRDALGGCCFVVAIVIVFLVLGAGLAALIR
jgi:hypothetical protein